jgi:hypothetical protein
VEVRALAGASIIAGLLLPFPDQRCTATAKMRFQNLAILALAAHAAAQADNLDSSSASISTGQVILTSANMTMTQTMAVAPTVTNGSETASAPTGTPSRVGGGDSEQGSLTNNTNSTKSNDGSSYVSYSLGGVVTLMMLTVATLLL